MVEPKSEIDADAKRLKHIRIASSSLGGARSCLPGQT